MLLPTACSSRLEIALETLELRPKGVEVRVNLSLLWSICFLYSLGKFLSCLIAALFTKTIALRGRFFAVLILVIIVIQAFTSTNLHESLPP